MKKIKKEESRKSEGRRMKETECGFRIAERLIGPLVNLTSVTDVVQIDATLLHVEFVKDAVIVCSQLEFGSASKSLVREICQP
jgi:hypothetical protein